MLNELLYMDDMRLDEKDDNELKAIFNTVKYFNYDIGMDFA